MLTTSDNDAHLHQSYLRQYFRLIGYVVAYYDYLLIFDDEVRYIWGCKGSILWIFYLNRYFSIFAIIPSIVGLFLPPRLSSESVCSKVETYEQVTIVIAQLITSVSLLLRTFALYSRSWKILGIILTTGFPLIGLIVWSVANQGSASEVTVSVGCLLLGIQNVKSHLGFAWVALIAYEVLIFLLTIIKSYRERNVTYLASTSHVGGLMQLICRDGAIYFAIMIWLNAANVVTFYTTSPALQGCLSRLSSSVSVSLISRLVINLRKRYFTEMQTMGTLAEPNNVDVLSLSFYNHISSTSTDDQTGGSASTEDGIEEVQSIG